MRKKNLSVLIFAACFLTYLTAYLCRVNLSSVMPALSAQQGFTAEQLGTVGSVFYAVYACGQLVNGYIGDRVRAPRFLVLALGGTALANTGMALSRSLPLLQIFWGLNGVFQSMFWSTIIRVLAQNTEPEKRASISAGISMAMPVAYLVSWSLLGQCLRNASASWYFMMPALAALVMLIVWLLMGRVCGDALPEKPEKKPDIREMIGFLRGEKLFWLIPICLLHGLVKEGVMYWLPLLAQSMKEMASCPTWLLVAIAPIANALGIRIIKFLLGKTDRGPYFLLGSTLTVVVLVCTGLLFIKNGLLIVGLMAVVSGICFGNNSVLMSFIPMQYTKQNKVASLIGLCDCMSYIGAAVSTYVLGRFLEDIGFSAFPVFWLCGAFAEMLLCLFMSRIQPLSVKA